MISGYALTFHVPANPAPGSRRGAGAGNTGHVHRVSTTGFVTRGRSPRSLRVGMSVRLAPYFSTVVAGARKLA